MTWTTDARMVVPLSMVMDGTIGSKEVPSLLIVWEWVPEQNGVVRLDPLYVSKTLFGATSRLTWHINRQTKLGKYLLEHIQDWSASILVELLLIRWHLDEAEATFQSTLKPRYHRGDRVVKRASAILRSQDRAFASGSRGAWVDAQADVENEDQSKRASNSTYAQDSLARRSELNAMNATHHIPPHAYATLQAHLQQVEQLEAELDEPLHRTPVRMRQDAEPL